MINSILTKEEKMSREDIIKLLSLTNQDDINKLQTYAYNLTEKLLGGKVYYRGIVEFSNKCALDCYYCGIRKSNNKKKRYTLSEKEIVEAAQWCAKMGYGSCVLQSGERQDKSFVDFVEKCIVSIKKSTISEELPQGLGITLSVGEQTYETYERFYNAGAHRYLLRVESSNPELFKKIHPESQSFENRINCLKNLKKIGYKLGTGMMIGLPGQSVEDIADDILFIKNIKADMIGMGPYIRHSDAPMYSQGMMDNEKLLQLSLNTIAVARIFLKNINIASTTALQALYFQGREQGIRFGANVIMPNLSPVEVREQYQLYDGKPCMDEAKEDCLSCLQMRVEHAGRKVGWNQWGDID